MCLHKKEPHGDGPQQEQAEATPWMQRYNELAAFLKENPGKNPPVRTPLNIWSNTQRERFHQSHKMFRPLDPEELSLLLEIGFDFGSSKHGTDEEKAERRAIVIASYHNKEFCCFL
jgi:Helicase associated domain